MANDFWPNGRIDFGQMGERFLAKRVNVKKIFRIFASQFKQKNMDKTYKKRIADRLLERKLAGKGAVLIEVGLDSE